MDMVIRPAIWIRPVFRSVYVARRSDFHELLYPVLHSVLL